MGMYTRLDLALNLHEDTPNEVINILKYMLGDIEEKPEITSKHPLFNTERWPIMLRCTSYYFDGHTDSSMIVDEYRYYKEYELNIRCNFKNYDNEVDLFLDYIKPFIKTDGFIGYTQYEEDDHPTLIYKNKFGIEFKFVDTHKDHFRMLRV